MYCTHQNGVRDERRVLLHVTRRPTEQCTTTTTEMEVGVIESALQNKTTSTGMDLEVSTGPSPLTAESTDVDAKFASSLFASFSDALKKNQSSFAEFGKGGMYKTNHGSKRHWDQQQDDAAYVSLLHDNSPKLNIKMMEEEDTKPGFFRNRDAANAMWGTSAKDSLTALRSFMHAPGDFTPNGVSAFNSNSPFRSPRSNNSQASSAFGAFAQPDAMALATPTTSPRMPAFDEYYTPDILALREGSKLMSLPPPPSQQSCGMEVDFMDWDSQSSTPIFSNAS